MILTIVIKPKEIFFLIVEVKCPGFISVSVSNTMTKETWGLHFYTGHRWKKSEEVLQQSMSGNHRGAVLTSLLLMTHAQLVFLYYPGLAAQEWQSSQWVRPSSTNLQSTRQFPTDMATGQSDLGCPLVKTTS